MMEDSNYQGNNNDIEMNNSDIEEYDIDYEYEGESEPYCILDKDTFKRLGQNDPSLTAIHIDHFYDEDCVFKSINWKGNDDCIANNKHLKELWINNSCSRNRSGFEEKFDTKLPTKEQLQYFFSSIHTNRSIEIFKITSVSINDEFGVDIIEGLSGHQSLEKLEIGSYLEVDKLGSVVCSALGQVLKHPKSKLKILHLRNCELDDDRLDIM